MTFEISTQKKQPNFHSARNWRPLQQVTKNVKYHFSGAPALASEAGEVLGAIMNTRRHAGSLVAGDGGRSVARTTDSVRQTLVTDRGRGLDLSVARISGGDRRH